jgi:hypothetical protein
MSCFPCLCLFTYGCVRHILCRGCFRIVYPMLPVSLWLSSYCVPYVASISVFFIVLCTLCCQYLCVFFVLCTLCCQYLWIVHLWLPLRYSLKLFRYVLQTPHCNFEWCNKGIHQWSKIINYSELNWQVALFLARPQSSPLFITLKASSLYYLNKLIKLLSHLENHSKLFSNVEKSIAN